MDKYAHYKTKGPYTVRSFLLLQILLQIKFGGLFKPGFHIQ